MSFHSPCPEEITSEAKAGDGGQRGGLSALAAFSSFSMLARPWTSEGSGGQNKRPQWGCCRNGSELEPLPAPGRQAQREQGGDNDEQTETLTRAETKKKEAKKQDWLFPIRL